LEEKKVKPKGRRPKKYTDDSIDSDVDDDEDTEGRIRGAGTDGAGREAMRRRGR
jgi:hypothetical protein